MFLQSTKLIKSINVSKVLFNASSELELLPVGSNISLNEIDRFYVDEQLHIIFQIIVVNHKEIFVWSATEDDFKDAIGMNFVQAEMQSMMNQIKDSKFHPPTQINLSVFLFMVLLSYGSGFIVGFLGQ